MTTKEIPIMTVKELEAANRPNWERDIERMGGKYQPPTWRNNPDNLADNSNLKPSDFMNDNSK
ncbi:MAG: hypothetical protein QM784_00565 [Polyangiaceae bacterium]